MLSLTGCATTISAFSTENPPFGPISALLQFQSIINVVIYALRTQTIPSVFELIGLLIGFIGAMILTIQNEMYSLWYSLTRCRPYAPEVKEQKLLDEALVPSSPSSGRELIQTEGK